MIVVCLEKVFLLLRYSHSNGKNVTYSSGFFEEGQEMKTRNLGMATAFGLGMFGLSASGLAAPVTYQIDHQGMHASIQFKIQHLGYSWLTGRFDAFQGEFHYDQENPENSAVSVTIDTSSVNTNHAKRDQHLRSEDFLNVARFSSAKFHSDSVQSINKGLLIKGTLTLNGVRQPIEIQASKVGEGKDPWGGYRAGFTGTTEFKLADFGITYDLGPAASHVYLQLDIEGIKQSSK